MSRLGYSLIFYNENTHVGAGGSLEINLVVQENYSGVTYGRIFPDGGAPPAFSPLVSNRLEASGLVANSLYQVDYKDDNGEKTLGKVRVFALANSCYNDAGSEQGMIGYIQISSTGVTVWTNVRPTSNAGREISIDGGVSWKSTPSANALISWSNSELVALGVDRTLPDLRIRRLSNGCLLTQAETVGIEFDYEPLTATHTKTDCTAVGADDGTISIIPEGGSGNLTYAWDDGPTTQNRTGLAPGLYSVTITDLITTEVVVISDIQISDPQPAALPEGSLLEIPMLNDLQFVVDPVIPDGVNIFQTPDNTLLINQIFPRMKSVCYRQKVCQADDRIVQFNSDFPVHEIGLYKEEDDTLVKSFGVTLKQENLNTTSDYLITIRNHTGNPGKSRVYFNVGELPIPLNIGDVFEILNNLDGFDGAYQILTIEEDESLGYEYLTINKSYTPVTPTSSATGRFVTSTDDFNTYESVLSFSSVAEGNYYAKIRAYGENTEKFGWSEPISVKASHPNTMLLTYRNNDPSFNINWNTGYIGRIRVESQLFKSETGGDRSTSRNSDYSLVKINAKKIRGFLFETFMLPRYLHEKLSVIFDCDNITINGVSYQTNEGYAIPSYTEYFGLANSSIRVEQVGWLDRYNSHDIGSINESGFLLTETGFLKL